MDMITLRVVYECCSRFAYYGRRMCWPTECEGLLTKKGNGLHKTLPRYEKVSTFLPKNGKCKERLF
eukprot:scaffold609_cov130-Cylindrotheca_fusiformis.AAC.11